MIPDDPRRRDRDPEWLDGYTEGLEDVRRATAPFTPELAAARTGMEAETIPRLARDFAAADGACAYGRPVCGRSARSPHGPWTCSTS